MVLLAFHLRKKLVEVESYQCHPEASCTQAMRAGVLRDQNFDEPAGKRG